MSIVNVSRVRKFHGRSPELHRSVVRVSEDARGVSLWMIRSTLFTGMVYKAYCRRNSVPLS